MKKAIGFVILLIIIALAVYYILVRNNINYLGKVVSANDTIYIEIQPLYNIHEKGNIAQLKSDADAYSLQLHQHLPEILGRDCHITVLEPQEVPEAFRCAPKYRADSIIRDYNRYYKNKNTICQCFAHFDISTTIHGSKNYGIVGLGFMPGKVNVISTHRIKDPGNYWKTGVHEILHNIGLEHCKNDDEHCLMCDAKGKSPKLDLKEGLCDDCKKNLESKLH